MEPEIQELFSCGDCPKTFIKRREYNKHRKHHDRPHACSLCTGTFGSKTDLDRHRKTHRNQSSEKDFHCKFSGCKFRGTSRKDYLWTHLQKKHHDFPKRSSDKRLREYYEDFVRGGEVPQKDLDLELLEAANLGDTERIVDLLSRGADISTQDSQYQSPLRLAVAQLHRSTIKLLCDHGADPDWAMLTAVYSGKKEAVEILVENGAKINGNNLTRLKRGPLYEAVLLQHANIANFLLEKGADVHVGNNISPYESALHRAVSNNEAITRILLKAGANLEAKDNVNMTPLDWSSRHELFWKPIEIRNKATTKLLLESGARIENCFWYRDPEWVETITKFASTCKLPSPQASQVNDAIPIPQEL